MRFVLDHNFSATVARHLETFGHTIDWHFYGFGAPQASDPQVFAYTLGQGAVLLTEDREFLSYSEIRDSLHQSQGIIVLPTGKFPDSWSRLDIANHLQESLVEEGHRLAGHALIMTNATNHRWVPRLAEEDD
ncbi:DUF5615 family PIN-like protein [Sulfobacillus harzensis]|uniref:DUF5615 family PIN-like protein n=1 Tax=Sulfobacillus harzensis TaxID=2729629 RepID=A0A7Y0Q2Q9_9FIRM|nr:DUF5615 family PIN-like protein [Sulfobacillus harzensis]NMP23433.1 DUF5615 family PIN-like protein [Sulfobacillus harzensis]